MNHRSTYIPGPHETDPRMVIRSILIITTALIVGILAAGVIVGGV